MGRRRVWRVWKQDQLKKAKEAKEVPKKVPRIVPKIIWEREVFFSRPSLKFSPKVSSELVSSGLRSEVFFGTWDKS